MGIVLATLPATVSHDVPVVAWNAHVDTSPETTGAGVKPQVDAQLSGRRHAVCRRSDKVIRVADNPD